MTIVITYRVDRELFYAPDTKHQITLITTEYMYRSSTLVHLRLGRNLGIRLNNRLRYEFNKDLDFNNNQFMFEKSYNKRKAKVVSRSTFEEKLELFDMNETTIEHGLVEKYTYLNKKGCSDSVQIAIREKGDIMTAVVDFIDVEQYMNFINPIWLLDITGEE